MPQPGGDVPYLVALGPPNPTEIVYAAGGYDAWRYDAAGRMHLDSADLSAEQAAEIVTREYQTWKVAS
jgi:hypothetical protein